MTDAYRNWRPADDNRTAVYTPNPSWECRIEAEGEKWIVVLYCDDDRVSIVAEEIDSVDDAQEEMEDWLAKNQAIITGR